MLQSYAPEESRIAKVKVSPSPRPSSKNSASEPKEKELESHEVSAEEAQNSSETLATGSQSDESLETPKVDNALEESEESVQAETTDSNEEELTENDQIEPEMTNFEKDSIDNSVETVDAEPESEIHRKSQTEVSILFILFSGPMM